MNKLRKIVSGLLMAMILTMGATDFVPGINNCPAVEAASTIKLNKSKTTLYVGNSVSLKLKGAVANKVKWSSKNSGIAKVSAKGKVTALKKGSTAVIAKYQNKSYTCNVTVKGAKISEETLSLRVGYGYNLEVVNTSGKVTWESSDDKIAKVNANGFINPLTVGKVTITAKVGSEAYVCILSVVNALTEDDFVFDEPDDGYTNYIDYSTGKPGWHWYWASASSQGEANRGINIGDTFEDFIAAYGYSEYTTVSSYDTYNKYFSNSAYPRTCVILDYKYSLTQKHYYKNFYFDKNGTLVLIVWHT